MKRDFSHSSIKIQKKLAQTSTRMKFVVNKNLNELYQNDDIAMHCYIKPYLPLSPA